MERTVPAFEARRQFGKLLEEAVRGRPVVIERHGEPVAALVPLYMLENDRAARRRVVEFMEKAAASAGLSPEEADRLAEEAVRAVRAEMALSASSR